MDSLLGQSDQKLDTLVAASAVHVVALVHQSWGEEANRLVFDIQHMQKQMCSQVTRSIVSEVSLTERWIQERHQDKPKRPLSDSKAYFSLWVCSGSSITCLKRNKVPLAKLKRFRQRLLREEPEMFHSLTAPAASGKYSSVHEAEQFPAGSGWHKISKRCETKNAQRGLNVSQLWHFLNVSP